MAKRRKQKKNYRYRCTISDEQFVVTREAASPDELMNVASYYEMHPEEDDRPEAVKKELGILEEN